MLSRVAIESARELADILEQRRAVLVPYAETPVANLVEQSEPVEPIAETVVEAIEQLATVTVTPVEGYLAESHDDAMGIAVRPVIDLINRRLTLARTVINPMIDDYANAMTALISDKLPLTPKIELVEQDAYYANPLVLNIFEGYLSDSQAEVDGFKLSPETDFRLYLMTGSRLIDEKIKGILETYGEHEMFEALRAYFLEAKPFTIIPPSISRQYTREVAIQFLAHFVLRKLFTSNELLPNEASEQQQELHLMKALNITANNVHNYVKFHNDNNQRQPLFAEQNPEEKDTIYVYEPMYRQFKEQQGNDISVFGAYLQDGYRNVTLSDIVTNAQKYSQKHDIFVRRRETEIVSARREELIRAAKQSIGTVISRIPADISLQLTGKENNEAEFTIRGNTYLNNPRLIVPEDVWSFASNIICIGLLPELELDKFFDTMESYLKPGVGVQELTPNEAAYYAILKEVVNYFMSQTSLDNASTR